MRYLFCLLLSFISIFALGQDPITEKMNSYGKAKPTANLFVHFDKNVYTNNETVYFTGYLLNDGVIPLAKHKILAIALIRNADSALIVTHKFTVQSGLSFGNFDLPDSVQTGNYHFLVYTDKLINGWPEATFIQQITLKTNIDPSFKASIKLMDVPKTSDKTYKVLISATTNDNRFLPKPLNIIYRYGGLSQKAKTDKSGQFLMYLPIQNNLSDPNVYVKLRQAKDSTFISMAMPIIKNKASVKFYPEGGNAVIGIITTIGVEIKDQQKMPMGVQAFLYKNKQVIDTIETNSYGMGQFKLRYDKNADYTLKLIHDGIVDSIYRLPKPLENGISLNIAKALAQDTLKLQLKTTGTKNIVIRLHNFRETFMNVPFDMESSYRTIRIPLTEIPKGLLTVTIADSLNRPLAERMVFAHYDDSKKLEITTDKEIYKQREKVNLKLNLVDEQGEGMVSVAVVQDNRLDVKNMNDIESYIYLKNLLANLPVHTSGLPYKDKIYLEQVLLIKGWRKYNWQELNQIKVSDTLPKIDSLTFTTQVLRGKKEPGKPVSIGAFGDSQLRISNTSIAGFLDLNTPAFITNEKNRLYLFINDDNKDAYDIKILDEFNKMSDLLRKSVITDDVILPSNLVNNAILLLNGNEKAIRLKEVNIQGQRDYSFVSRFALGTKNACGDYVCIYDILNCRNHKDDPANTEAVVGVVYRGMSKPYAGCITYKKKDDGFLKFDGIHFEKEFYVDDYKDPLEPAFFSTIYWNYLSTLNGKKALDLSFYTSDITGKFRIIVQGIVNNDVSYTEHLFEVKAKQ